MYMCLDHIRSEVIKCAFTITYQHMGTFYCGQTGVSEVTPSPSCRLGTEVGSPLHDACGTQR